MERNKPPTKRLQRYVSGQVLRADSLNDILNEVNKGNTGQPYQKGRGTKGGGGSGGTTTVIYAGFLRFFTA